jgi:Bacterial Ig-like domain
MRRKQLAIPLFWVIACGRAAPWAGPPTASPPAPPKAAARIATGLPVTAAPSQPDVAATRPLNDAIDVPPGQQLDVTFNEAMDPATLTPATFTVTQGAAVVDGLVSYDAASETATFTPALPLGASLPYDAVVDVGARSVAGQSLVAPLSWSFTTRSAAH